MSVAGTLLILLALFSEKWLIGAIGLHTSVNPDSVLDAGKSLFNNLESIASGDSNDVSDLLKREAGLFLNCKKLEGSKFFEGECIPDWEKLPEIWTNWDDSQYPHPWRAAILCFGLGLGLMVITDLFALLTVCCRSCICCSLFTICGSIQSFAGILFTLGLIAYPAGWGAQKVKNDFCDGTSEAFILGKCDIGFAFWLAVAGTVCTVLASSLAIWAYQSTRSVKCEEAKDQGEHCICLV